MTLTEACAREIVDLHVFFQSWFRGTIEHDDETFARASSVLAPSFEIIGPGGAHMTRPALLHGLRDAHGQYAEGSFAIEVKDIRVFAIFEGLYRVTYEEWQQGGNEDGGRISTAILRANLETPNGVEWLHVHETWLPGRGAN